MRVNIQGALDAHGTALQTRAMQSVTPLPGSAGDQIPGRGQRSA
jgi:hypothetical protein